MSSACVCHIDGEWCFYCEMYSPLETENGRLKAELKAASLRAAEWEGEASGYAEENEILRAELMSVFQRARNDVTRREGGQCVGTVTFHDYPFAQRLVRDLEPILFPEVDG